MWLLSVDYCDTSVGCTNWPEFFFFFVLNSVIVLFLSGPLFVFCVFSFAMVPVYLDSAAEAPLYLHVLLKTTCKLICVHKGLEGEHSEISRASCKGRRMKCLWKFFEKNRCGVGRRAVLVGFIGAWARALGPRVALHVARTLQEGVLQELLIPRAALFVCGSRVSPIKR